MDDIEKNFSQEFCYLKATPDFRRIFLGHISSEKEFNLLKSYCSGTQHPFANMILGLMHEHGYDCFENLPGKPKYEEALKNYKIGAERNEPYCLYRLFYIYKNDYEQFDIDAPDDLKQVNYLIKAAAYFDEKDNRYSDKVKSHIFYRLNKQESSNFPIFLTIRSSIPSFI
jgi:TPR repeat protein